MTCIIIFWPQAVGKMTVWYELEKLSWIPLFHNHMTIDLIVPFFDFWTSEFRRLVDEFRRRIFEEVGKSQNKGIIFTYVWAFNAESDTQYIQSVIDIFESHNKSVYLIELEASLENRLARNESDFRLSKKPLKRNIEKSKNNLLSDSEHHRLNSLPWEITHPHYLKINNDQLSPTDTARMIYDFIT